MAEGTNPGENKAWDILTTLKPDDVCKAAAVSYDMSSGSFLVNSFGMEFSVAVKDRTITSKAAGSEILLKKLGYFSRLSILWYLVNAKDIACSGRFVKLERIPGGDIFTRGSHTLPLDSLAAKYGKNKDGFIERGKRLGGELVKNGDASLRLFPLPRVPVTLALWLEDEEFPARAELMLDSTCALQLPVDIIWSVAMMTILAML